MLHRPNVSKNVTLALHNSANLSLFGTTVLGISAMLDFTAWEVDLTSQSASHPSGFTLSVEGRPSDPSAVSPGKFPTGLSAVEQARLLRTGIEAIAKAAESGGMRGYSASPSGRSNGAAKPNVVAKKASFSVPANKPKRAKLSLKKS